jgi:hypothetical protein
MRKQMLLIEMHNVRMMLLENRVEFLKKNYIGRLMPLAQQWIADAPVNVVSDIETLGRDLPDGPDMYAQAVFNYVLDNDPDTTKKNSQWLLNMLLKDKIKLEDLSRTQDLLKRFMTARNAIPADRRDILRYKSPGDLAELLQSLAGKDISTQGDKDRELEREMYKQAEVVYNDSDYRILIPKTRAASCHFGVNTQWCTAATGSYNYFDDYNSKGPLFIILEKKTNTRWQFQFETSSFMDEMDRSIDRAAFVKAHPKVAQFFAARDAERTPMGTLPIRGGMLDEDLKVYLTDTGIEIGGSGRGIMKEKPHALLGFEGGQINLSNITRLSSITVEWFETILLDRNPDLVNRLIEILNEVGRAPSGGITTLAGFGIFHSDRGYYGGLDEVGTKVLSTQSGDWYAHQISDSFKCYGLFTSERAEGRKYTMTKKRIFAGKLQIQGGFFSAPKPKTREQTKGVIDLILADDGIIALARGRDMFSASDFNELQAQQIVRAKPSLASPGMLLKAKGPRDENLRKQIVDIFNENDIRHGNEFTDDRMVLESFADVHELVDQYGNDDIKWFGKIMTGDEYLDGHDQDISYVAKDLLNSLKPEDLKKLGDYMAENHAEWIEEKMEDEDDYVFDPTSVDDIYEMQQEVDDDNLDSAFRQAASAGSEAGMSNEAYELFRSAVESHPYIFFETVPEVSDEPELDFGEDKPKTYSGSMVHDTRCVIAVPVSEIVAIIEIEDDLEALAYEGSFLNYKEEPISAEQPRYGLSDYDEDAAAERFAEEIAEIANW